MSGGVTVNQTPGAVLVATAARGLAGPGPTDAQIAAAVAAYLGGNPVTPVTPPTPGATGVLDFSDPANSGLLAALGIFGAPFVLGTGSALDFTDPANSGLVAVLGV